MEMLKKCAVVLLLSGSCGIQAMEEVEFAHDDINPSTLGRRSQEMLRDNEGSVRQEEVNQALVARLEAQAKVRSMSPDQLVVTYKTEHANSRNAFNDFNLGDALTSDEQYNPGRAAVIARGSKAKRDRDFVESNKTPDQRAKETAEQKARKEAFEELRTFKREYVKNHNVYDFETNQFYSEEDEKAFEDAAKEAGIDLKA